MLRKITLLSLALMCITTVLGQKGTIRGYVYDDETQEPMIFAVVTATDSSQGVREGFRTDANGYFHISKLPKGTYTLEVQNAGFAGFKETIELEEGQIFLKKVYMKKGEMLTGITVRGTDESKRTEVGGSITQATKRDIEAVPMVGGTKDIVNYLTAAVPGAITTGDQGGQVYIRGGSPIQNKVLLDGMIVYNPFHSIGFFSVFDTDIISSADIYTGGYNAEYGGRISSVMDIKTRNGNKTKWGGKVDVNPFMSKLLVEGPIWNNTDEGKSSASVVLSAKSSYLEQTSKVFYPYANKVTDETTGEMVNDTVGLPFNFTDIYGKFAIDGGSGSKFNIFGFNFSDQVKYQAISDLNWNSWGVGSNFVLIPASNPVLIEGDFSFSDYNITLKEENLEDRYSRVNGFNLGFDFTYFLGKSDIKYGVEVQGFRTEFQTFNAVNRTISQSQNTTEVAGYIKYKMVSKNNLWVLDPSFRLHYYASLNTFSPEPRLGVKYNATDKLRFKLAAGIYSQNLIQANSDRDVVNLFYGFLSGPDNLQSEFVDENGNAREVTHKLQKANHLIIGAEYDLTDKLTLNVEGYVKDFTQLTNMNRNKIFEEEQTDKPDVLRKDFIIETGLARGVDVLLKYKSENVYLWLVYSLGKVDRWDGFVTYAPVFDRRHNVNLVGTWKFGKDKTWEMNHRWNFGSGFPFTQTAGFYQSVDFQDGIGTDYTTANATELAIQYDSLNGGRLPTYHRYDLTLSKSFNWYGVDDDGKKDLNKIKSSLMVTAGVTNLYNRSNVFYVNRITAEVVRQLPAMPSLAISFTF